MILDRISLERSASLARTAKERKKEKDEMMRNLRVKEEKERKKILLPKRLGEKKVGKKKKIELLVG